METNPVMESDADKIARLEAENTALLVENAALLAKEASWAVEKAHLESLARLDDLTELPNRRQMTHELSVALANVQRQHFDLVVAEVDLDFFKRVNDQYGHPQGDAVLKAFAKFISQTLRDTDFFGRWGGEEFLLILPIDKGTSPDEIMHLFTRYHEKASQINRSDDTEPFQEQTISIGAVCIESGQQNLDPEKILKQVDVALYESKQTRDTTTFKPYQPDRSQTPS